MDFYCCIQHIDWTNIWAFCTVLATLLLAGIAWKQLTDLSKTAQSEFLHKLKSDFFTRDTRELMILLETSSLHFNKDTGIEDFAIFEIKVTEQLQTYLKHSVDLKRKYYATQEVDDFLLGHLEDAGLLLDTGKITIHDANQQFQYYVKTVYENEEIKKYISWAQEQGDDTDIYQNLKNLYEALEKYDQTLPKP